MTQEQVPVDHFSYHVRAKLDHGFVGAWTRELYANRGRPNIDPVVFTVQLVMFFEGIRSERKQIQTAILNLAHRWHLGSALDKDIHNHSSLTRICQRLGIAIFQHFFEKNYDPCREASLVRVATTTRRWFPSWGCDRQLAAACGGVVTRGEFVVGFGSATSENGDPEKGRL